MSHDGWSDRFLQKYIAAVKRERLDPSKVSRQLPSGEQSERRELWWSLQEGYWWECFCTSLLEIQTNRTYFEYSKMLSHTTTTTTSTTTTIDPSPRL
ncbi:hypothetical protein E2C01_074146 [Portunus trituberculatus]|uniref:Uncharacterized protein n=1 Tax=Portunus trituberculatus TaxID=210409 RepID=A0A5B7I4Y4_PORTR|nr:hypothetical protein [Portunus trituberculatus]